MDLDQPKECRRGDQCQEHHRALQCWQFVPSGSIQGWDLRACRWSCHQWQLYTGDSWTCCRMLSRAWRWSGGDTHHRNHISCWFLHTHGFHGGWKSSLDTWSCRQRADRRPQEIVYLYQHNHQGKDSLPGEEGIQDSVSHLMKGKSSLMITHLRWETTIFKQPQEIGVLAVNVTTNFYGRTQL